MILILIFLYFAVCYSIALTYTRRPYFLGDYMDWFTIVSMLIAGLPLTIAVEIYSRVNPAGFEVRLEEEAIRLAVELAPRSLESLFPQG